MRDEELAEALQEVAPSMIMEAMLPLRRVRRWRGAAIAACLLLVCCAAWPLTMRCGSSADSADSENESAYTVEDVSDGYFTDGIASTPTPQWLPQGYVLTAEEVDGERTLYYEKDDSPAIVFSFREGETESAEDAAGETVMVGGIAATLQSEGDGILLLRWEVDCGSCTLCAAISREELLRIAESVS